MNDQGHSLREDIRDLRDTLERLEHRIGGPGGHGERIACLEVMVKGASEISSGNLLELVLGNLATLLIIMIAIGVALGRAGLDPMSVLEVLR